MRRKPPSLREFVFTLLATGVLTAMVLMWCRAGYRKYVKECQPVINAQEKLLADISGNAGDPTIQNDLSNLSGQVQRWRPDLRFMLGKGQPQSFEELKRSLDDLRSYAGSFAMCQMFRQKQGEIVEEQTPNWRNDMRAYANTARDHLNRALAPLADGR